VRKEEVGKEKGGRKTGKGRKFRKIDASVASSAI